MISPVFPDQMRAAGWPAACSSGRLGEATPASQIGNIPRFLAILTEKIKISMKCARPFSMSSLYRL
jgi:hypothetical protein